MNSSDTEICPNCGQGTTAGLIFHELYCYDVYIVSAPSPQNTKQRKIDEQMSEKIVKHLESNGFICYHGSRDIYGGEHLIQALSKPITIIPTTIIPVYEDKSFSAYRNLLLRVEYLDRIVFLLFDSTQIEPPAVSKNSFSIAISDPYLLPKLKRTIETKANQIPLHVRQRKLESSLSSASFDTQEIIPFRRSDTSRISFRIRSLAVSEDGAVMLPCTSTAVSPHELLSFCHSSSINIWQGAAKALTRTIRNDFANFSESHNLEDFENQIRYLRQKRNTMDFEKLYFWISAAIFFKIYKCDDSKLKIYMKMITLSACKASKNEFEQVCQKTYYRLTVSLHAKIKAWPHKLDNNDQYVKKCEDCLSKINLKLSEKMPVPPDDLSTILSSLPWDIKHIFIVSIAEKLFQKKYTSSSVHLFSQICKMIGKKHWAVYIDILEKVTEYVFDTYTKELLVPCLQIIDHIVMWKIRRQRRKDDKLNFVLKHMMTKLVYHPVALVRNYVSSIVFLKHSISINISQLGSSYLKVNEDLVEECIREHLFHSYSALTIHEQVSIYSPHMLMFEAKAPEGDSILYVFRQKTLNNVLNTNSTDAAYEVFQEMLRAIRICQGQDNIVKLRNAPSNSALPFCIVEHGKPLLSFLHEKENQLSWMQMIDILIDITKAIHHCHNENVILRDITPASFIICPRENGSLQTKLASFLYAKCLDIEEPTSVAREYANELNFHIIQGDRTEVTAAYFSAPETLLNKTFSKYSEAWMLAATFYSILLYGKCPFQELAHLSVFQFVNEIIAGHTVGIPKFLPKDLSEILSTNLNVPSQNRMTTEAILSKLETCKNKLVTRNDTVHAERTVCCYINSEDILRGYIDKEHFVEERSEDSKEELCMDKTRLVNGVLTEIVSVRMGLNTRRKIQQLIHENILTVEEIRSEHYITILVSKAFDGHTCPLSEVGSNVAIDQLFSYFEQIALALLELHKHNIVHCDLRCKHIYINQEKDTVKVSHFGRSASLENGQTYVFKMMPSDADKWSAPEVRTNQMYSKASDIFSLALVFVKTINKHKPNLYSNLQQRPPHNFRRGMEENPERDITDNWKASTKRTLAFMKKCQNPNQTKRPTLDMILEMIQQIRRDSERYWSIVEEHELEYDETNPEDVYESIIENPDSDFAIKEVWEHVVIEIESSCGIKSISTTCTEMKETCTYGDIGLPTTKTGTRTK